MKRIFEFDQEIYFALLNSVAKFSRLYSASDIVFFHYRFIEKLFVFAAKGLDLSRSDIAFDALLPNNIGVGVKTFVLNGNASHKFEKVQEFTRIAGAGGFSKLSSAEIALNASIERNKTIQTDAREYGIEISSSIYHCLIRTPQGAIIHEEPYSLIDVDGIYPINRKGERLSKFPENPSNVDFSDGINQYKYSKSKNVLFKKFEISDSEIKSIRPLQIEENIFEKLLQEGLKFHGKSVSELISSQNQDLEELVPGKDYVILPLYNAKGKTKKVEEKSGINQWNAAGRKRKFGEAYIPIPSHIHKSFPDFFPSRDTNFNLKLPNLSNPVSAKVCQDAGKALMTNPNDVLCKWLYRVIDPEFTETMFDSPPRRKPYSYKDLANVGRDAVRIVKLDDNNFELFFSPLGSFEDFKDLTELES